MLLPTEPRVLLVSLALAVLQPATPAWAGAGHEGDLGWMTRDPPQRADPRLQLVWQEGRSLLFKVRRLGIPTWKPRDF